MTRGEFYLLYQPKVYLNKPGVAGFECLLRWQNPRSGILNPQEFIPLIENKLESIQVGEWVIKRAIRQLAEWNSKGLRTSVSVNVSPYHLRQNDFSDRLIEMMAEYPSVDPGQLMIEVLETVALDDLGRAGGKIV